MARQFHPYTDGPHTVVEVVGELDVVTAPALRDSLLGLLNRGAESLVVDLRGVSFLDSSGVGSLVRLHHRQELLGGQIQFVADQSAVLRVLDMLHLTDRLHVVPSIDRCSSPGGADRRERGTAVPA